MASLADSLPGHTPEEWAADFLRAAGFPVTPSNLQVVVSWEYAESGGGGARFNPLNTTQTGYPGETPFNDNNGHPVMNYTRYEDGIASNAKVIHNGYYPAVVAALRAGNDAQAVVNAIVVSPWGTRHIQLRGGPIDVPNAKPAPAPIHKERSMVIVPGNGAPPGRRRFARVSRDGQYIEGVNGAKCIGMDGHRDGDPPNIRRWIPKNADGTVAPTAANPITGVDRDATDNTLLVAALADGATYAAKLDNT